MSKRNTVSVTILSAFALTLCLFSTVINAQKGAQGTASSVKPVRGIDVVVMDNSGNIVNRTTNEKGEATFAELAPGKYSLAIVDPSKQQKVKGSFQETRAVKPGSVTDDLLFVEIDGAVGGPMTREWSARHGGKFATLSNASAKAMSAPHYEEKINFDVEGGNPVPVVTIKIKEAHSNALNN